jgi:putative ABC transport system permease protein
VLAAALRDLVWRRKRFVITLIATALVFAMTLVMSGLAAAFPNEIDRVLTRLGGDAYFARTGASGPIYSGSVVSSGGLPDRVGAVLFAVASVPAPNGLQQVSLFGVEPGKPGDPIVNRGRRLAASGEAVVSVEFGRRIGEQVVVADATFTIVGLTTNLTMFGGQPTLFVTLPDAQRLVAGGQPVATFLLAEAGTASPPGTDAFARADARADFLRPLKSAGDSISFVKVLLWIVAACIVGSVVFLSALERTRDFAVFKATGASTRAIGVGLLVQAIVLVLASSALAAVIGLALAPFFPMPVEIPFRAIISLPFLAVVIACLASLIGLRRAVNVPPGAAFGGVT